MTCKARQARLAAHIREKSEDPLTVTILGLHAAVRAARHRRRRGRHGRMRSRLRAAAGCASLDA